MEKVKLYDALDGLFAYDTGCVDSGIKDESLREQVKIYLDGLGGEQLRLVLSRFIRESYLTEEALSEQYGIEDVSSFIKWLGDSMDISL